MKNIKLFEKWLKKALNNTLIFQNLEEEIIIGDGYLLYKIKKQQEDYLKIIKKYTFQDLTKNFKIRYREITELKQLELDKILDKTDMKKIKTTNLINQCSNVSGGMQCKIFKSDKDYIFVNIDNIKVENIAWYEVYGKSPIDPIMIMCDDVEIWIMPVRVTNFAYEINEMD